MTSFAQQETYDVVSYSIPKGWQKQQVDGGVQLFITDNKTGGYAIAIITKTMGTSGSANDDFNSQWKSLLVNTVTSITKPVMIDPVKDNGWEILSGNGNYVDRNVNGVATLITATGGQQTAAVVLMTNTQQFHNELVAFATSLKLKQLEPEKVTTTNQTTSGTVDRKSVVGLWISYINETSGYVKGVPMYTAGYFRREYFFYADGTYLFRTKDWSVSVKDILFIYETGNWTVNGTKLTLTPAKGKGGWWSKSGGKTNAWGGVVKASDFKLEKQEYTFTIEYFSGSQDYSLNLRSDKPTQRDGGNYNASGEPNVFRYSLRTKFPSLIDNPPGLVTGFENKSIK